MPNRDQWQPYRAGNCRCASSDLSRLPQSIFFHKIKNLRFLLPESLFVSMVREALWRHADRTQHCDFGATLGKTERSNCRCKSRLHVPSLHSARLPCGMSVQCSEGCARRPLRGSFAMSPLSTFFPKTWRICSTGGVSMSTTRQSVTSGFVSA